MTISTTGSRISYNGNGVTTAFSFPYFFFANGDLVVSLVNATTGVETAQVLNTDYTVTGAGDGAGGTVTMTVAPASGYRLVVYRDTAITQDTDYISGDAFPAETHERALDKLTVIAQEREDELDRSIKAPASDPTTLDMTLPADVDRKGKFLAFDPITGEPVASDGTVGGSASVIEYMPAGTGAISTNAQSKLREFVSVKDFGAAGDGVTDDTAEVQAAVAHCVTSGDELYWPDGTYLTTATIPNFHLVRHRGPGTVQRGSDVFYVEPKEGQTNILYVRASGGSSLNDGFSNSQGMSSLQVAFNALKNYWPLDGKWVIQLGAGTYTGTQRTARLGPDNADPTVSGVWMRNPITIKGPDVGYDPASAPTPTPTAIFDAAGVAAVGIALESGVRAVVRDLKFTNYNGSASSIGVYVEDKCWLLCENVHADNCTYGINAYNMSFMTVKGGTMNNCLVGIQSLFNCQHTIGNAGAGAPGQGPFITNCSGAGFRAQEGSTGHSDYVSYTSNGIGVDVQVNSRVNLNGSDFKLNSIAVRAASNANVFPTGVAWNTGTANANTENLRIQDSSSIATLNSNTWRSIARQTTTQSVTGIVSGSIVWTGTLAANLYTSVPGSTYLGKALRVTAAGTISGSAGTKTIHLRIGGTILVGIVFDAANTGAFFYEGTVYLTSSSTQKIIARGQTSVGAGTEAGYATATINTASATDLSLTLTTSLSAADTIVFELVDFEVQG